MLTSKISRVVVLYKISYSGYRCLSKDPTNGVLTTGPEQELISTRSDKFSQSRCAWGSHCSAGHASLKPFKRCLKGLSEACPAEQCEPQAQRDCENLSDLVLINSCSGPVVRTPFVGSFDKQR